MDPSSDRDCTLSLQGTQSPKLLDRLRQLLAARHFGATAIERYVEWNRRFILFHQKRHPETMGNAEIEAFLQAVAREGGFQGEARDALGFLYREVLRREVPQAVAARVRVESAGAAPGGMTAPTPESGGETKPRLLDRARATMRVRHYSLRTEECYVMWMRRYILFHHKRHPLELGGGHIEEFLTHLAVKDHVSASTQNQAFHALLFLYKQVLEVDLPLIKSVRSQRPRRLPVVMSRPEVRRVLDSIEGYGGLYPLMARLMYGTGMRLMECCRLRVKDVDWQRNQILVRQGKGDKDRVVMLPRALKGELEKQADARRTLHEKDLTRGVVHVPLPDALERKYPNAVKELGWQFLFASR
jgi:integron integrase